MYLILLRNSTSITWISWTEMPDTSAQVLLVYVLSSRTTYCQLLYGVIGQEQGERTFVPKHQCHGQESKLAPNLPLHSRIEFL